jgi:hypothetical protein
MPFPQRKTEYERYWERRCEGERIFMASTVAALCVDIVSQAASNVKQHIQYVLDMLDLGFSR